MGYRDMRHCVLRGSISAAFRSEVWALARFQAMAISIIISSQTLSLYIYQTIQSRLPK